MKKKPFNLEKSLAGEPVVTRDGREVTQLTSFNLNNNQRMLAGVIDGILHPWGITGSSHIPSDDLFMASNKDDWKNWTTLKDICDQAGEDVRDYAIPYGANRRQRGVILFSVLQLICEVFQEGTELDYSDISQLKYYLWGNKTDSSWSLGSVDCSRTGAAVGARLSVDSREKAEHIWKHFQKYFIEFWEG